MVTDCSSVYTAAPDVTRPNDDDASTHPPLTKP